MNTQQLQNQCNLYRLLLNPEKHSTDSIESYLEKALELIVSITDARLGYVELTTVEGKKLWTTAHCEDSEIELIKERISSTIISEALETGETIVTGSAFLDDRFCTNASVIAGQIESVLCSPIKDETFEGVIYLQGPLHSELDKQHKVLEAEIFTQSITPLLKRLRYQISGNSPEQELRKNYKLDSVIGNSRAFSKVLNEAMTIAGLDVTVMLLGETGTGKSFLAKTIHTNSPRANASFIHINCANIPENLVESELFGAVKGSYSGATNNKGKILAAEGGTLFLDEISELPINAQAKLLQFLEEGIFYPLGSNAPVSPDVRIITAGNVDFLEAIQEKRFREDLYYRISTFPITLPPLRNRKNDVPALAEYFVQVFCKKFQTAALSIEPSLEQQLQGHNWPGNIRELENKIQQGIIRARFDNAESIKVSHIFSDRELTEELFEGEGTYHQQKGFWEKSLILSNLKKHSWNVTKTAKTLDISRSHLNNLIKTYELVRDKNE